MKLEYFGIRVRDMDRAVDFYTNVLGLEFQGRKILEWTGGEVAGFKDPESGQILELNWYPDLEYRAGDELDHLGFHVKDAKATLERLQAAGCEVAYPLEDRGEYWYACVTDPDGIWLEIYSVKD